MTSATLAGTYLTLRLKIGLLVVAALGLAGCALLVSPIPVYVYEPQATWGEHSDVGGCPGGSPAIRVNTKNPDWVRVETGIWHSQQTELRKFKDPTLFIVIAKGWHFSISEQEKRVRTPISVKALNSYIEITLADGTRKTIDVPELTEEFSIVGDQWNGSVGWGKTINVSLEVPPQDMAVLVPDLVINGEVIPMGRIFFKYQKESRVPC